MRGGLKRMGFWLVVAAIAGIMAVGYALNGGQGRWRGRRVHTGGWAGLGGSHSNAGIDPMTAYYIADAATSIIAGDEAPGDGGPSGSEPADCSADMDAGVESSPDCGSFDSDSGSFGSGSFDSGSSDSDSGSFDSGGSSGPD